VRFNGSACGAVEGQLMSKAMVRSGKVSIEFDRGAGVLLLICDRHRIQDAIPLERETLGALMVDFFERHESCSWDHEPPIIKLD
jgi:hypothetical protein